VNECVRSALKQVNISALKQVNMIMRSLQMPRPVPTNRIIRIQRVRAPPLPLSHPGLHDGLRRDPELSARGLCSVTVKNEAGQVRCKCASAHQTSRNQRMLIDDQRMLMHDLRGTDAGGDDNKSQPGVGGLSGRPTSSSLRMRPCRTKQDDTMSVLFKCH
jgi:hypothetical protein